MHCISLLLALFSLVAPSVDKEQAFVEWATKVEKQLADSDGSLFDDSWNMDAFMDRVFENMTDGADYRAEFQSAAKDTIRLSEGILELMSETDGSYMFLRMCREDRALFRRFGDDGLDYHEVVLELAADGETVEVVDFYSHSYGEMLSDATRRTILSPFVTNVRGLSDDDQVYHQNRGQIRLLTVLSVRNPTVALEVYDELPEILKGRHEVLLRRAQAAAAVGDEVFVDAMEDFQEQHPDSPAVRLMRIELYTQLEQYASCYETIDELDDEVSDGACDLLRAATATLEEKYDQARAHVDRALERDERLGYHAVWARLVIAMLTQDHPGMLACLMELEGGFGVELADDLTEVEAFAQFVKSEHYQALLRFREERETVVEKGNQALRVTLAFPNRLEACFA